MPTAYSWVLVQWYQPGDHFEQFFQPLSPWSILYFVTLLRGFSELYTSTQYKCLCSVISFLVAVFGLALASHFLNLPWIYIYTNKPLAEVPTSLLPIHLWPEEWECSIISISAVAQPGSPEPSWLYSCVIAVIQWRGILFVWTWFHKGNSCRLADITLVSSIPCLRSHSALSFFTAAVIPEDGVQRTVTLFLYICQGQRCSSKMKTVPPDDVTAAEKVSI